MQGNSTIDRVFGAVARVARPLLTDRLWFGSSTIGSKEYTALLLLVTVYQNIDVPAAVECLRKAVESANAQWIHQRQISVFLNLKHASNQPVKYNILFKTFHSIIIFGVSQLGQQNLFDPKKMSWEITRTRTTKYLSKTAFTQHRQKMKIVHGISFETGYCGCRSRYRARSLELGICVRCLCGNQ